MPESKRPYSGYWYPEINGGTDVGVAGNSSPLDKYDDAFYGGTNRAAKWERENHTVKQGDAGSDWAGHCNGLSAASQRHKEPGHRVKKVSASGEEVWFEPQDIKALLAEIHMSAKYFFIGGNRCESGSRHSSLSLHSVRSRDGAHRSSAPRRR